jgi:hypothetical protein
MIAGEQFSMTKRFYWEGSKAPDLDFAALAETGSGHSIKNWPIRPISGDRLTS